MRGGVQALRRGAIGAPAFPPSSYGGQSGSVDRELAKALVFGGRLADRPGRARCGEGQSSTMSCHRERTCPIGFQLACNPNF